MGFNARGKGARGENQVLKLLQPVVDKVCDECGQPRFELLRDHRQRFEKKRLDIIGLPWLAVEVKWREGHNYRPDAWWRDQVIPGTREGQIPVMFHKQNRTAWKVRMRVPVSVVKGGWVVGDGTGPEDVYQRAVRVHMTVDVKLEDFMVWFMVTLKKEINHRVV